MISIQIVLLGLIALIIFRIIWKFREKNIDLKTFVWWIVFWIVGAGTILVPEGLNRLADIVGVGRGVDVVVYTAIILLFFLAFKLYLKTLKIEKDIVKIIRALALHEGPFNTIRDHHKQESKDDDKKNER